jgi:tetratricopeptide (TPR) repeat protein
MSFRHLLLALCVATLIPSLATGASADETDKAPDAVDAARQRYQAAVQAYGEHRYKDAIDLFLAANRASPNPAYAYNIGLAYEDLGDADNALLWYRNYLRDLPNAPDRPEIEARVANAEARLRERGVQQVTILSKPPAATVTIDGERLGVTPWTGQLPPGRHRVQLELPGHQEASETFDLPSDHAIDYAVTLEARAAEAVPPKSTAAPRKAPALDEGPPPEDVEGEEKPARHTVRPLTWGFLGAGVVGFGTAIALELARASNVDDARHASSATDGKKLYDSAKTDQTGARVALIAGSAFAITGGVLLYLDLSSGSRAHGNVTAGVGCDGRDCGVAVHGHF